MTSQQQRLEELKQQAKALTEKIDRLEDQLNNAEPTTGLLGRWATNRHGKQVLITTDRPVDGWIETTFVSPDGTPVEMDVETSIVRDHPRGGMIGSYESPEYVNHQPGTTMHRFVGEWEKA